MKRLCTFFLLLLAYSSAFGQNTEIRGRVWMQNGESASDVLVQISGSKYTRTDAGGTFSFSGISSGTYLLRYSGANVQMRSRSITVKSGEILSVNDTLQNKEVKLQEVTVVGASRRSQKITEAPAAVSVVLPQDIERGTAHGQLAKTLEHFPGVDIVQSGMNDFNVNMRGFNNSINRRVLVLLDGRDPSTPLLNLVEWNSFQTNLADVSKIEVVRGPGSALYGANAYNGVINVISESPRAAVGTRISMTGGELNTLRGDIRHAGVLNEAWSYKLNVGYSRQDQAWISSRDTSKGGHLEYAGLAADLRGNRAGLGNIQNIDSLINENRVATNLFGTARIDYNIADDQTVTAEFGASRYGGEYFVNTTGRILINDVEKPFARFAYNSKHWNIQTHWNRRNALSPQVVLNAAATSSERSDVAVVDAQWNDSFLDEKLRVIGGISHEYQHVNTTVVGATPLLSPDDLYNNFSGLYAQLEYSVLANLHIVGAARFDRSTFVESQFSPKGGIVYTPMQDHTFRLTVNRSFLRPSYGDKYRRSVVGGLPPSINLAKIDSTVSAITGVKKLDFASITPAVLSLGNPNVDVETALSYEFGYKGILSKNLFVTADMYWNRRSNFISQALGGLAPEYYSPFRYGNKQADSLLRTLIGAAVYDRFSGLSLDVASGKPALIVTPTNIGLINEYGAELGVNYYVNDKILLSANYAYLGFDIVGNKVSAQKIVPNTSPNRYNFGIQYEERASYDVSVNVRGVQGFTWVAGTFEGNVPEYWVVNLNANLHVMNSLQVGLNVFNLLDREHYEIFGGTLLHRLATVKASYTF